MGRKILNLTVCNFSNLEISHVSLCTILTHQIHMTYKAIVALQFRQTYRQWPNMQQKRATPLKQEEPTTAYSWQMCLQYSHSCRIQNMNKIVEILGVHNSVITATWQWSIMLHEVNGSCCRSEVLLTNFSYRTKSDLQQFAAIPLN